MNRLAKAACVAAALVGLAAPAPASAQEKLRPFVLASETAGTLAAKIAEVTAALGRVGFELAGQYAPYEGAHVIVVTDDELRRTAAKTKNVGFGAGQRVSVTQVGDKVQVAYANPPYWAAAFRMEGRLAGIADKLKTALGGMRPFGSEDGITEAELRDYHYMIFMPYFDDEDTIGRASTYQEMIARVEQRLASRRGGVAKVYRIDIPGKEETVFGVSQASGISADKDKMGHIDVASPKHTAHLPYEFIVSGNRAYALNGKFRIAISFPDLTMGTFIRINDVPSAIRDALSAVASE